MRVVCLALACVTMSASAGLAQHSRYLNDLNWMEVEDLVPQRVQTVLLAVGTLEAHGVGPNGADNLVPEALADHLAGELDALIAPTISYGVNTSLDEYAGTFGVTADLLRELAEQVYSGLAATGFSNIIVLNGHGPNFGPLNDAALDVFTIASLFARSISIPGSRTAAAKSSASSASIRSRSAEATRPARTCSNAKR